MRKTGFAIAALMLAALACTLTGAQEEEPTETPTPAVTNTPEGKPTIVIDAPPSGAETGVNQEVFVQSTSTDTAGITRVVLQVDGVQVSSDESPDPEGQPTFTLLQSWTPNAAGTYSVSVTAFRGDGTASDPATISVSVVEEEELAEPLPLPPILANLPPTSTSGPCERIIRTHLNVRSGPGISNDRLATLDPGAKVPVKGRNNDSSWYYVGYSGGDGWISAGQAYSYSSGDCSNIQVVPDGGPQATPDMTMTAYYNQTATAQATITATLETPQAQPTAPADSDHTWDVGRDDGTAQFAEFISYPDGDTEDTIFFSIVDLTSNPGENMRNVTFTLICVALGGTDQNVDWGVSPGGLSCGQSLNRSYTDSAFEDTLTVKIETGDYAYIQYTINAIITAP